jgi:hypothetical protein
MRWSWSAISVGNCRLRVIGLHIGSSYRFVAIWDGQNAIFVVSNHGRVPGVQPFEPGSLAEKKSGACGMDTLAIKSYLS